MKESMVVAIMGCGAAEVWKERKWLDIVGQDNSDSISCTQSGLRGPLKITKPNIKKALVDIYESLKIPYAPSYFTTLLQSQINSNLKPPLSKNQV